MLDLSSETVLSLAQAARAVPKVDGQRPSTTTLWRWCVKGLGPDRVRLEHIRVGRRVCTSREAINRFLNATAENAAERLSTPPRMPAPKARTRTKRERQRAIVAALDSLTESGVIDAATATDIAGKIEQ